MGLGLLDFIAGLIDKEPEVPDAPKVDAQAQQTKAIAGNTASLPALFKQAGSVNAFNQDQLLQMLRKAIPGYDQIMSQAGSNLNSQLRGEIPQDVSEAIKRGSATKALYAGFGGSGMANNLTARDLGLTSLDITNKALDSASRWITTAKAASVPGQFDVKSMFVTPALQIQNEWQNKTSRFQRDWVSNQIDQQYSWQHQLSEGIRADSANVAEITKSSAGSMMGGAMCWIAREIFGETNPKWILFRHWIATRAPKWFFDWYRDNGEMFARFIRNKPMFKNLIRIWMESRIATL